MGRRAKKSTDPVWSRARIAREKKGIKLEEMATRTGFSKSYLSYLERGQIKEPIEEVVEQYEEILGISLR